MTRLIAFLVTLSLGGFGLVAKARAETIAGYLEYPTGFTNYFDPANGYVPPGYANEAGPFVTIPGTFGFFDGANLVTASFTHDTLTIEDVTYTSSPKLFLDFFETTLEPVLFRDFWLVENTFSGLSYVDFDGALIINWPGTSVPGDAIAKFVFAAPEPSTWAMLLLGFAGFGLAARRHARGRWTKGANGALDAA